MITHITPQCIVFCVKLAKYVLRELTVMMHFVIASSKKVFDQQAESMADRLKPQLCVVKLY